MARILMVLFCGTLLGGCAIVRALGPVEAPTPSLSMADVKKAYPHGFPDVRAASRLALAKRHFEIHEASADSTILLAKPMPEFRAPDERIGLFLQPSADSTEVRFAYERGWWGGFYARDFRRDLALEIRKTLEEKPAPEISRAFVALEQKRNPPELKRNRGVEVSVLLDFFGGELGLGLDLAHFLAERVGYAIQAERSSHNPDFSYRPPLTATYYRAGPVFTLAEATSPRSKIFKLDLAAGLNYTTLHFWDPSFAAYEGFVDDQGFGVFTGVTMKMILPNGFLMGAGLEVESELTGWFAEVKARIGYKF